MIANYVFLIIMLWLVYGSIVIYYEEICKFILRFKQYIRYLWCKYVTKTLILIKLSGDVYRINELISISRNSNNYKIIWVEKHEPFTTYYVKKENNREGIT